VAASLSVPGEQDCFSFSGNSGEVFRALAAETSGSLFVGMEIRRPNNTVKCSGFNPYQTCTLDATGAHTIVVMDDNNTNTGGYNVSLQKLTSPNGCGALAADGSPVATSLGIAAEQDCFSFSANSGESYRVLVAETSGSVFAFAEIARPGGLVKCGGVQSSLTCALDASGQHTIVVGDDDGANTGNYNISLLKLASPNGCSAITPDGGAIAGALSLPAEQDCFSFNASSGEVYRSLVAEASGSLFAFTVFARPNGSEKCTGLNDFVSCTSDAAGGHTLVVIDFVCAI
jgi:hypothetical protein